MKVHIDGCRNFPISIVVSKNVAIAYIEQDCTDFSNTNGILTLVTETVSGDKHAVKIDVINNPDKNFKRNDLQALAYDLARILMETNSVTNCIIQYPDVVLSIKLSDEEIPDA